jgi:hypothetical protein
MAETPAQTPTRNAILIDERDNVVTVTRALAAGEAAVFAAGDEVVRLTTTGAVPDGHKVARCAIAVGDAIMKYGEPIATATCPIGEGDHVHTHNVRSRRAQPDVLREQLG